MVAVFGFSFFVLFLLQSFFENVIEATCPDDVGIYGISPDCMFIFGLHASNFFEERKTTYSTAIKHCSSLFFKGSWRLPTIGNAEKNRKLAEMMQSDDVTMIWLSLRRDAAADEDEGKDMKKWRDPRKWRWADGTTLADWDRNEKMPWSQGQPNNLFYENPERCVLARISRNRSTRTIESLWYDASCELETWNNTREFHHVVCEMDRNGTNATRGKYVGTTPSLDQKESVVWKWLLLSLLGLLLVACISVGVGFLIVQMRRRHEALRVEANSKKKNRPRRQRQKSKIKKRKDDRSIASGADGSIPSGSIVSYSAPTGSSSMSTFSYSDTRIVNLEDEDYSIFENAPRKKEEKK